MSDASRQANILFLFSALDRISIIFQPVLRTKGYEISLQRISFGLAFYTGHIYSQKYATTHKEVRFVRRGADCFTIISLEIAVNESMLLRLAVWQYRIANSLNIKRIAAQAEIKSHSSLSRFLSGSSDIYNDSQKLVNLLNIPVNGSEAKFDEYYDDFFYNLVSSFFCNMSSQQERDKLDHMNGRYEAFQWSSTKSGKILISDFQIFRKIMPPMPTFFNVIEMQKDNNGSEELYKGCCVFSSFCAIFLLHQTKERRPKFIICDEVSSNKYKSGLVLKRGTSKNLHLTPICLRRVYDDVKIEPTIVDKGSVKDDNVMNILNEEMTPFNPNDVSK